MLFRRRSRHSLIDFVQHSKPDYNAAPFHRAIAEKLEAVERGEVTRLIIEAPPRHGKSELASIRFPAWFLGRDPKRQIITCSASSDLAIQFGRSVRNLVNSHSFSSVFEGAGLSPDSQSANRWHTNHGGSYLASGVGGQIVGFGADLLIVDDPVRSRKDAESSTVRDDTWNWFRGAAYTRLMPGSSAIIIIMTRWHEDDLVGRILSEMQEPWERLRLPAITVQGTTQYAVCPERFPVSELERIRANIGEREWNAQYQQSPSPDEGAFFKREWVQSYSDRARLLEKQPLSVYLSSDWALTDDDGDYTVHAVIGVNPAGHWFLLDLWRAQVNALEATEAWLAMVEQWKPLVAFDEQIAITKGIGPFRSKLMQERGVHCRTEMVSLGGMNKLTRASHTAAHHAASVQGRFQQGMIHFPSGAPYTADLIDELLAFPYGKHDDMVDCFTLFGLGLDMIHNAGKPPRKEDSNPFLSDNVLKLLDVGEAVGGGRYGNGIPT